MNQVSSYVDEHIKAFMLNEGESSNIDEVAKLIARKIVTERKCIYLAGNGGSAADSQHFAAELVGRFETDREPLKAVALTTDTSAISAIGNDFGFAEIFSRQLKALGNDGDIFLGISTSGNSKNIVEAAKIALEKNMTVILLSGSNPGIIDEFTDFIIRAKSKRTSIIQEFHIFVIHCICREIDRVAEQLR